ncbi:MAG TPA: ferritin-like domain-containing protein [Humisphaera sp.]
MAANLSFNDIPGTGDVKVLNYALLLEQLENSLYKQAALRLQGGGKNGVGKTIPGLGLQAGNPAVEVVVKFGLVEYQHRNFLHDALGAASLLRHPTFRNADFDFGIQSLDAGEVLNLVYVAERTGVGAYLGAITKFKTRTYLQTAGAIQGTEARHTAAIARVINLNYGGSLSVAPLANDNNGIDRPVAPDTVLKNVGPFIVL